MIFAFFIYLFFLFWYLCHGNKHVRRVWCKINKTRVDYSFLYVMRVYYCGILWRTKRSKRRMCVPLLYVTLFGTLSQPPGAHFVSWRIYSYITVFAKTITRKQQSNRSSSRATKVRETLSDPIYCIITWTLCYWVSFSVYALLYAHIHTYIIHNYREIRINKIFIRLLFSFFLFTSVCLFFSLRGCGWKHLSTFILSLIAW